MSVVHAPDSEYAKEMTKWEALPSVLGPGLRPYVKRDWPCMVYRAQALPAGGIEIVESDTADDEQHYGRLKPRGFRLTPADAIAAVHAQQTEAATLAAERGYDKQHKLSPQARAEVQAQEDAAGSQHLPTIPETPIKKRGRPVKIRTETP